MDACFTRARRIAVAVLVAGALGGLSLDAVAAEASGEALSLDGISDAAASTAQAPYDLPNPPEVRSRSGVLRTTLVAKPGTVTVAGRTFQSNVYNGLYIPPTLRVRRGDRVELKLVNRIGPADAEIDEPQVTNIHFHGMDVTPKPPGDNVFVMVPPKGGSFQYDFKVPDDHPEGLHWYHSHHHGFVDQQILSGLSGMLIVDGGIESHYPELAGLRQRVMVLKDINLPGANQPTRTINGFSYAPVRARPGQSQLWMIGNIGADGFFDLKLDGHDFWVLERDGNFLTKPVKQKTLFLPPGARTTVVVTAGDAGRYPLRSTKVNTGPTGLPSPEVTLGTFIVGDQPVVGSAVEQRLKRPAAEAGKIAITAEQVRKMPITGRRTFTFSDAPDFSAFYINGKTYKEDRIDTTVHLGDVEEWTIRNTSGELHVFHLHQTAFLVTEVNGAQPDYLGLRDVIDVPYTKDGKPGEVKVIIPFTDPIIVGTFVYHCHIVGHEDAGMMANIRVLPRQTAAGEGTWDWLRSSFASLGLMSPAVSPAAADEGLAEQPDLFPYDPNAICRSGTGGKVQPARGARPGFDGIASEPLGATPGLSRS